MKLPTLYKKTKTGATQEWSIETVGAEMITRSGQLGGAMIESRDTIKRPKSQGTVEEQADAEAAAKHTGKKKKGYVLSVAEAQAGATDEVIEGGILPMLAFPYEKVIDDIRFPCYMQPKLDGHRCLAEPKGLWSRTRKPIRSVPHIAEAVADLGIPWLDGELYVHAIQNPGAKDYTLDEDRNAVPVPGTPAQTFEEITSLLRKKEPAPGHEMIQYHIYDIPCPGTFEQRWEMMLRLKPKLAGTPLRIVETVRVADEAEMWATFDGFREAGYEGAIVRNAHGLYERCRSPHLAKLKKFQDAEFKIVGMEEGRGKLQGHCGAFVCALPDGNTFKAKMVGPLANLKTAWENQTAWIGHMLTVKFQDLTSAGVPRFPVAMRKRTDLGEPAPQPPKAKASGLTWAKVSTK